MSSLLPLAGTQGIHCLLYTSVTDLKSGKVLQSNRWWLELIEGDNLYRVDMSGQPREVCEAVLAGAGTGESKIESLPKMTFEAVSYTHLPIPSPVSAAAA